MASLRETKDRISSVKSTLKITSAMKLVASSKLRKSQKAIENLRPYERTLNDILLSLSPVSSDRPREGGEKVAVVAISSNSSLCGGFNANVIKKALETVSAFKESQLTVYSIGRKMADAMRKAGYPCPADFNDIIAHPSYELSCELARSLAGKYEKHQLDKVVLVYSHFASGSRQYPVVETYLPFCPVRNESSVSPEEEFIVEPSAREAFETLLPQVLMLKFHAAILDSSAAEHAARTMAMQTATDNAQELLQDLTLEYNKGRQQKITAEILDLVGGSLE